MKKTTLLFTILFTTVAIFAQENDAKITKRRIGITFSGLKHNNVVSKENLVGAAGYSGDKFYRFGINYIYSPKCDCVGFETGIEYAGHKIIVSPNLPPGMDNTPYSKELTLISIPVLFRANVIKYIFFNGGISLDFDASTSNPIDSQTGIGGSLGLGLEYDFKFGMSVMTNVYTKSHSLISFAPTDNHQRLLESGIRFGVLYKL